MMVSTIAKGETTGLVAPDITAYAAQYKQELLQNILPFWLKNGKDRQNGGYFTCLDRKGQVFDTDKFMWLQGRGVWCFSYMYHHVSPEQEWLDMAVHGADFMEKYGRDAEGNWYFSLTTEGKPLVQPYNIFSDCFATMGFAALDKVLPSDRYKQIAVDTFENILRRQHNWKGVYNKAYPGTRSLKNFSLPMILSNLALSLEHILGADRVNSMIPSLVHDITEVFYKPEYGLILENVMEDGGFSDSFEGRLVNPGHTIEAMWFIMDLAVRMQDESLVKKQQTSCCIRSNTGGIKNMADFFISWMLRECRRCNWNGTRNYGGYMWKHWWRWLKVMRLPATNVVPDGLKRYTSIPGSISGMNRTGNGSGT